LKENEDRINKQSDNFVKALQKTEFSERFGNKFGSKSPVFGSKNPVFEAKIGGFGSKTGVSELSEYTEYSEFVLF